MEHNVDVDPVLCLWVCEKGLMITNYHSIVLYMCVLYLLFDIPLPKQQRRSFFTDRPRLAWAVLVRLPYLLLPTAIALYLRSGMTVLPFITVCFWRVSKC